MHFLRRRLCEFLPLSTSKDNPMKTLGLIGGTSWVSTVDYYKIINQEVNRELGGNSSAKLVLYSIDFSEFLGMVKDKDNDGIEELFSSAGNSLKEAGADALMMCANTIHRYADVVLARTGLPLIHIARETADAILLKNIGTVGLLGTLPTMTESFYRDVLSEKGIEAIIPEKDDRLFIHRAIFKELSVEIFKDETRSRLLEICNDLFRKGADGIILGCTELPLIITQDDLSMPVFDTLRIHAEAGARFLLSSQ